MKEDTHGIVGVKGFKYNFDQTDYTSGIMYAAHYEKFKVTGIIFSMKFRATFNIELLHLTTATRLVCLHFATLNNSVNELSAAV